MRHCSNCGKQLDDSWTICPFCGTPISEKDPGGPKHIRAKKEPDKQQAGENMNWCGLIGFILAVLSTVLSVFFCVPSIVGLVLCTIGEQQNKTRAKCAKLAITGKFWSTITLVFWAIILIVSASCLSGCTG